MFWFWGAFEYMYEKRNDSRLISIKVNQKISAKTQFNIENCLKVIHPICHVKHIRNDVFTCRWVCRCFSFFRSLSLYIKVEIKKKRKKNKINFFSFTHNSSVVNICTMLTCQLCMLRDGNSLCSFFFQFKLPLQ